MKYLLRWGQSRSESATRYSYGSGLQYPCDARDWIGGEITLPRVDPRWAKSVPLNASSRTTAEMNVILFFTNAPHPSFFSFICLC
jgi:hypothetical protein